MGIALQIAGVAAAATICLSGCSSVADVYELKVNASSNEGTRPLQSYRLETKGSLLDVNALRYKETETEVKAALAGKGMFEAPQPEKADIVIDLDYGIGPPLLREETVVTQVADSNGNMREHYDSVIVTKYEKRVEMTAHENQKTASASSSRLLWGIEVTNEDTSKDLRKYLPVMIGASIDYIGRETGDVQTIKIDENDPAIAFVKRGL